MDLVVAIVGALGVISAAALVQLPYLSRDARLARRIASEQAIAERLVGGRAKRLLLSSIDATVVAMVESRAERTTRRERVKRVGALLAALLLLALMGFGVLAIPMDPLVDSLVRGMYVGAIAACLWWWTTSSRERSAEEKASEVRERDLLQAYLDWATKSGASMVQAEQPDSPDLTLQWAGGATEYVEVKIPLSVTAAASAVAQLRKFAGDRVQRVLLVPSEPPLAVVKVAREAGVLVAFPARDGRFGLTS